MTTETKGQLQEAEYIFPYHYLPGLTEKGQVYLHRYISWGLDYLTYMSFISELICQSKPKSMLDVGCGDGRLINMVKGVIENIYGIDLSQRAIDFARAFNPEVEFQCVDVASISQKFDLVTLTEVLEHIPDDKMDKFVQNIADVVNKDGRLLVSVPTVNMPLIKKHYRHYDLDSLKSTLEPHFTIEKYWWLYRGGCFTEKCIRRLLCNSVFILNSRSASRVTWRLHKKLTFHADASTGFHLIAQVKLKSI